MIEKDVKKYWTDAAKEYRETAYKHEQTGTRYPFYEVRMNLVLEMLKDYPKGRLLDAGCGGGRVLSELLALGYDGYGLDIVDAQVELARETLQAAGFDPGKVRVGSIMDLSAYEDKSFDVITSLGVMEYIKPDEEKQAFAEARRVLKDDGVFLVENINNLFDISTFNRFTVNFFMDHFVPLYFSTDQDRQKIREALETLMTNPEKPDTRGKYSTTRDQVYTKAEIPIIYGKKVKGYGFVETDQAFYRFHPTPPLLFEREPELEKIGLARELEYCRHWAGNFLASGFISVLRKD